MEPQCTSRYDGSESNQAPAMPFVMPYQRRYLPNASIIVISTSDHSFAIIKSSLLAIMLERANITLQRRIDLDP